jgi:hypothetical protein
MVVLVVLVLGCRWWRCLCHALRFACLSYGLAMGLCEVVSQSQRSKGNQFDSIRAQQRQESGMGSMLARRRIDRIELAH